MGTTISWYRALEPFLIPAANTVNINTANIECHILVCSVALSGRR